MDFALTDTASNVNNIVTADSLDIVQALFPEFNVVTIDAATGSPYIGHTYDVASGKFQWPQPFASWSWMSGTWEAPVAAPTDGRAYTWDESQLNWIEHPPFPSWTFNTTTKEYDAPIPKPTDGKLYRWDETAWSATKNGWVLA